MSLLSSVGVGYGKIHLQQVLPRDRDAVGQLGTGVSPNAIIVFASSKYDQKQMIDGVRSVSGNALYLLALQRLAKSVLKDQSKDIQ